MLYRPSMISLSDNAATNRIPPRPKDMQQDNYLEKFDFQTIFSDVLISGGRVWLIGPPFLNLEEPLKDSVFRWNGKDVSDSVVFENFNRMSRASFSTEEECGELSIQSELGCWRRTVNSADPDFLASERVIVTQQQNNRLEWIAYWAYFNVVVNGASALVIYDNKSNDYSLSALEELLSMIPGLKKWVIVDWKTPYGVTGGPANRWDSDFGQYVSWEHSRRAFTMKAKSVMIIDVDELPVTTEKKTIFEQLESSNAKAILFKRQPIRAFPNRSNRLEGLRVHGDYSLGETRGAWLAAKYAYVPARLEEKDQLKVHLLEGENVKSLTPPSNFAGHFDAIRIRWRISETLPVQNFKRAEDIKEDVSPVQIFDQEFDQLSDSWSKVLQNIKTLINKQRETHI